MDSDGFITLDEAATLPCPYQPPYSELPFDAEILASAAKANALEHWWRNGVIVTLPTCVERWGRNPTINPMRAVGNLSTLANQAGLSLSYEKTQEVMDALKRLPPSSGQRDLEHDLILQR